VSFLIGVAMLWRIQPSADQQVTAMNKNLYEFKVVVLGDKGVGKTCLVLRFIEVSPLLSPCVVLIPR
jgi:hypothetical protein